MSEQENLVYVNVCVVGCPFLSRMKCKGHYLLSNSWLFGTPVKGATTHWTRASAMGEEKRPRLSKEILKWGEGSAGVRKDGILKVHH